MGRDASRVRAHPAPADSAILDNLALTIVRQHGCRYPPEASPRFMVHRDDAFMRKLARRGRHT